MNHPVDALGFSELDAMLERAYALDEPERSRFVDSLPEPQRDQLRQLLEVSQALTLKSIAADARVAFEKLERQEDEQPSADASSSPAAGRWRLHKELGSGGMGQVFYATREAPEGLRRSARDYVQEAAIKILWSMRAGEEVRARFLRERRLLASLSHPGLARFVDGGFLADGRPWFAMEYVAGSTIDTYAQSLSLEERLRLFIGVCATVAYAHQRLIVHRDIKPMNVLVDESGRARLLDFGIAGVLEDIDDGVHTRTAGGPLTLQYASPEQLTGGVVTVASDIYQLGLMLYLLLTGQPPYDLKDVPLSQALEAVRERVPPKPSSIVPGVGRDIDAIVMTALAKDPDDRYRSATALAEDVQRYLEGRPVRAVPQTFWYVARRFLRRNAAVAIIVTATVLALAGATVLSVRMAREAQAQAARSRAAQQILSDVFQKADPYKEQGATTTLADALVRAKPDIAARVKGDPLLAWEVNRTLGEIYESLGLVEEELSAYKAVVQAARQMTDSDDYRLLTGVSGVGNVLARTNPVEAVRYFDANLPAQPPSEHAVEPWLDAQYAYVGALSRVREFGRADAGTFAMAKAMDTFGVQAPRKRGRLSQLLAGVAQRAGDTAAEDRHWQDMVESMRAVDSPPALAVTLNNWGIHLGRRKRYEESEAAFLEALAIFEDAGLQDPTFATVLRGYAGLMFRTGRIDEAIAASQKSLSLLPPNSQFYARFVAELNLAQYMFVKGDLGGTIEVFLRALPAAQKPFADDPAVPRRMLRLFGKAMVFGGAFGVASKALGYGNGACQTEVRLLQALESLEHRLDQRQRKAIWTALDALEARTDWGNPIGEDELNTFLAVYRQQAPIFFDALDHWRVLNRLSRLQTRPGAPTLPAALRQHYEALTKTRQQAATLVRVTHPTALSNLASYFKTSAAEPVPCP